MKKLLLAVAAVAALSTNVEAKLKKGDLAPDFTLNDINGVSHHLYAYLDSGYTVIIDESAAWCNPCWTVHSSHVFNDLIDQYGPNGTIQPKKIRVIFIEGETSNTTTQLYGPQASTGSNTTATQGDWVTGTKYPLIDNPPTTIRDAYLNGGFPTFTVIGQDRIVYEQVSGYSNAMLKTKYWTDFLTNGVVPVNGPSATTDVKMVDREIDEVYVCKATPTVRIQNYGTHPIAAATIKIYSGSNTTPIVTENWTGNLAKYAVADVQITSGFSQTGPYKFEVTVANDAVATNNSITVASLKLISSGNAGTVPVKQNFESLTAIPSSYVLDADGKEQFIIASSLKNQSNNPITVIGSDGKSTNCIGIMYPNNATKFKGEMILGSYNTSNASIPTFIFDLAYQQRSATSNDQLEILASDDCGATWKSVYNKSGSQLATLATVSNSAFIPVKASDWRTESSQALPKGNEVFVKIIATTSAAGTPNYAWIDNFNFVPSLTSVGSIISENELQLYPNPVRDVAYLEFTSVKASNIIVQVVDMTGRVVADVANKNFAAGVHKININTASLPSGIYNVKIQTDQGSCTKRLTIVH